MKKLLTALLTFSFIVMMTNVVSASADDYKYTIKEDDTVRIDEWRGEYYDRNIEIPSEIEGKKVTEIGASAFELSGLTSVVIPESVEKIGDFAFAKNRLKSIEIPFSVEKVNYSAFSKNSLAEVIVRGETRFHQSAFDDQSTDQVVIQSNFDSIKESTLAENDSLKLTHIKGSYAGREVIRGIVYTAYESGVYIDDYIGNETDIEIPAEIEGIKVISIEGSAFKNSNLTSVKIPSTVQSIRHMAFANNHLKYVEIPSSVEYVGEKAFENNELKRVKVHSLKTEFDEGVFDKNKELEEVEYDDYEPFFDLVDQKDNATTYLAIAAFIVSLVLLSVNLNNKSSTKE
uniref:leucine-rich repeat domain-containing protein n=1 Tax=uncultured Allobacillus sp. TaxID=1638025 RepID=UPI002597E47D|nr:leucine-rich repeat domain-containing protein [uncultured Allobacillus sp.]